MDNISQSTEHQDYSSELSLPLNLHNFSAFSYNSNGYCLSIAIGRHSSLWWVWVTFFLALCSSKGRDFALTAYSCDTNQSVADMQSLERTLYSSLEAHFWCEELQQNGHFHFPRARAERSGLVSFPFLLFISVVPFLFCHTHLYIYEASFNHSWHVLGARIGGYQNSIPWLLCTVLLHCLLDCFPLSCGSLSTFTHIIWQLGISLGFHRIE